jgi:hypothetical protein
MLEICLKDSDVFKIFVCNSVGCISFFIEPSVEKIVIASKLAKIKKRSEKCSICMGEEDEFARSIKLDCGHHFDSNCIVHWVTKNQSCPICRSKLIP